MTTAKKVKAPSPANGRKSKGGAAAHLKATVSKAKASISSSDAVAANAVEVAESKLVRDSFTIPKSEYMVLETLKLRSATLARPAKKGELLRAGICALNAMGDKAFLSALAAVPSLKTGRPKRAV